MPCLNEAETLVACLRQARAALDLSGLAGEIVIADNGSTDGSQALARALGARVVDVAERGYGSALRGGIESARGAYIVVGDADGSYDFAALGRFVAKLREGYDLVMGNRFKGGIEPGAMPWKHRWIGNPGLTGVGRLLFGAPVGDFHCGLRAFTADAYRRMGLETSGMEFASEVVVKASLAGLRITEIPTVLRRDGRSRRSHLRSWRDGWRHLRFMLLFSPRWLFMAPGLTLFLLGALLSALLVPGPLQLGPAMLDVHTLLVAGFACLVGHEIMVFAAFTKVFAVREGYHRPSLLLSRLRPYLRLEVGLVAGMALTLIGAAALVLAVWGWQRVGFGHLNPRDTMRQVIPGVVLAAIGVQTVFASFFLSILNMGSSRQRP